MTLIRTPPSAGARHFVLVHGACHGGWSWYKLFSLLKDAGHKVTALDLAASGRNQVPLYDLQTIDDYHQPLFSFLVNLSSEERVILVGHSMGGYAISSAMERFPTKIALAVFVAAFMVGPDLTVSQIGERYCSDGESYEDSIYTTDGSSNIPTSILFGPQYMSHNMYQRSSHEDLVLATLSTRIVKFFNDDKSKLQLLVTKEKYGTVRRVYITSEEDKSIPPDVQLWMIQNNPPDEVREIAGADHMVMASKPKELYFNLLEFASYLPCIDIFLYAQIGYLL